MKKETSIPFGKWLLDYKGGDPLIQDLRDDYDADYSVNFKPKKIPHLKNPEQFRIRVAMKNGCPEACESVKQAAILYGEPLVGWELD
tara:strand:+ start:331 stop:591 length:261 start_codon:yes stop_codon:yes gene_type:complete